MSPHRALSFEEYPSTELASTIVGPELDPFVVLGHPRDGQIAVASISLRARAT